MKFPSSEPQDLLTQHLLEHPHALGFVGVGIGKTSATLNALSRLLKSGESKGALVIAPMRVANLTWPMEVQRWDDFNWMRVANLRTEGGKRAFLQGKAHIYVVNFEALMTRVIHVKEPRKPTEEEIQQIKKLKLPDTFWIKNAGKRKEYSEGKNIFSKDEIRAMEKGIPPIWGFFYREVPKKSPGIIDGVFRQAIEHRIDTIIVDESTKWKDPGNKGCNQMRRFLEERPAKRIWALTGTPAPNTLMDLFAQVRFVDGGKRLGRASDLFKQTYFRPTGYQGRQWKELPGSQEKIENRIADITLTLRSKDWLNLPETVVEDVDVPLPADLANRYREFERELVLEIRKDKDITAANAAALVSKLLQFTSGSVYDEEGKYHELHDLKLKALERIAKEADSPLLVAVAFKHELARIRERFPQAKFFQDAKGLKAQKDMLEEWNAGKIPMLVAHPKSMSHGLNLQAGGNNLVWMSLTYSRDDYEQTIGRLERRGQDAVVKVWRIMCPDTVDYAVATVVEEKRATEDRLLTALQLLESCRDSGRKIEFVEEESWI